MLYFQMLFGRLWTTWNRSLAETEGFEPSIQVLAQMLP